MKLIHTSDWHIGKTLQKEELTTDLLLFFDWLMNLIKEEEVDVVIIAGDIFDQANSSAHDRKMYYDFLKSLIQTNTKVIITGGNHDSPKMLEVSKDILELLDITVVGGVKNSVDEEIIEIRNEKGIIEVVICAVPFLRDSDLRKAMGVESTENRIEQIRAGIKNHYYILSELCKDRYHQDVPVIAMGHLYAQGASISESEREIQIGNQAGIDSSVFDNRFGYVALGHIHKPQRVGKSNRIQYSGSPIPLSFSERKDRKKIILLTINEGQLLIEDREIPPVRMIKTISGSVEDIQEQLINLENPFELPAFIELLAKEEMADPRKQIELGNLVEEYHSNNIRILKSRIQFENTSDELSDLMLSGTNIDDLSPGNVFNTLINDKNYSKARIDSLNVKFDEILNKLNED